MDPATENVMAKEEKPAEQHAAQPSSGTKKAKPAKPETTPNPSEARQTEPAEPAEPETARSPSDAQQTEPEEPAKEKAQTEPAKEAQPAEEAEPAQPEQQPPQEQQDAAPSAGRILANAPTLEQLEKELKKERMRVDFGRVLRNTLFSLIVVASVSALIAVLFLPVLQIHGTSMAPTLSEQDIVAAVSVGGCRSGDLIAFYYNNNILVKRVIAGPGDWVNIDEAGNVSVNGQPLEEPYLDEKALGNCDLTFPYQVPDARYFVMGDQRTTSIDSRSEVVGCISREMIIGRIVLRVWPLETVRLF